MSRRWRHGYRPYVSVVRRRMQALREMERLRKRGEDIRPVEPFRTRGIARTFWGKAWCEHLEKFSDYSNRLPRGRTYVRNGSVCHLLIEEGRVSALVMGNSLYEVVVEVKALSAKRWEAIRRRCGGRIGSLIELLEGRLSEDVMEVVTDREDGLFPHPREIALGCSCPDWATMCKHVAAVLYGVGVRLDEHPELLFLLRGVDHEDLIASEAGAVAAATGGEGAGRRLAAEDLGDIFGIEVEEDGATGPSPEPPARPRRGRKGKGGASPKKAGRKGKPRKAAAKKPVTKRATRKTRPEAADPPEAPATGEEVGALRRKLKLTQKELALFLGVSPATVGKWERKTGPIRMNPETGAAWLRMAAIEEKARDLARADPDT